MNATGSDRRGLYDGFRGYRIPTDDELDEALRAATVVVDANVLLSLYRYNETTRHDLLDVLRRLDDRDQALVIHEAAARGGRIEREAIYELCGYEDYRMLRGFTRPTTRITHDLQDEGIVAPDVEPALTPVYVGVKAAAFRIPSGNGEHPDRLACK